MADQAGSPSRAPWPFGTAERDWRPLETTEIEELERDGNRSGDWAAIRVRSGFRTGRIRDCRFYGPVRIGVLTESILEYHDLRLPVGLYGCTVVACDIGDDTALHNVRYLARTEIHPRCLLFNIDEIITTDHAKFGNGLVMDGEDESVRIWLEIANENGGRRVLPFDGMLPADAWIWSKYRDDSVLMERFEAMTAGVRDTRRGSYGRIGSGSVIKDCRILKDVQIGESAYIKGCNKLKNLTINSDPDRPTQLGEGCELVNGIIGYGCRVFYGVKAVRFILNDHSNLKYGARLINSILGPNSTISCCEVLNSLLFGAHEQHHNSSFLCAAVFKGQTNMASAATVGSNHNSRASDGEIVADRGFWPGLAVSLKHNSRFAAFTLIAKGAYPAELDVRLPFCLVANDESAGELKLLPGYWFHSNMYALARNAAKSAARDKRVVRHQELEFDWLAPDTVDQMLEGRRILEAWADESDLRRTGGYASGRALLEAGDDFELSAGSRFPVEAGRRPVRVLHAGRAWRDYGRMVRYYIVRTLLDDSGVFDTGPGDPEDCRPWINLGGQLICGSDMDDLKDRVKSGSLDDWNAVHRLYRDIGDRYGERKRSHARALRRRLVDEGESASPEELVAESAETAAFLMDGIRSSRLKDYENPFRNITFESDAERDAVLGRFADNEFIADAEAAYREFMARVERFGSSSSSAPSNITS